MEYAKTDRNQVKRVPTRGVYDQKAIFQIIDESWICHIGFAGEQGPAVIPMFHARIDDQVIIHGAQSSRLMRVLKSSQPICLSFAIVDGLVLAKSLFHHSMNYRSAVVFGMGKEITEPDEKIAAFKALTDKAMPDRWDDARQPNGQEIKATAVVAVKIETGSAKIRTGGPAEEPEDESLPHWTGVVPIKQMLEAAETDMALSSHIPVPSYVERFRQQINESV